jgi:hypothetical protein
MKKPSKASFLVMEQHFTLYAAVITYAIEQHL